MVNQEDMSLGDILGEALKSNKSKNKMIYTRKGNDQYRFFGFNRKIELMGNDYSYGGMGSISSERAKYGPSHIAVMLHAALTGINLVTEVSIRPYEISIEIADPFESDEEEWARIICEAKEIIGHIVFGTEQYDYTVNDQHEKYNKMSEQ